MTADALYQGLPVVAPTPDPSIRVLYVGDHVRPRLGERIMCLHHGIQPTEWIAGVARVTQVHPEVRVRMDADDRELWLVDGHHATSRLARSLSVAAA